MIQNIWENRATVRSRPRAIFEHIDQGFFFPISHQPLAIHPKIQEKGTSALNYLLIQSLYKYTNDISTIETRVVNNAILNVTTDSLPIKFTSEQKLNLYTIMVDEAYHAYAAYDVMLQIEDFTKISPLPLPKQIEIEKALLKSKEKLKAEYHGIFDLICVCLAENTLTKEIVTMIDKVETHSFFQKMVENHLADESRHSGIFIKLLAYIWERLNLNYKQAIADVLPEFIERYLGFEVQKDFDRQILIAMDFSESDANKILNDTYAGFKLGRQHPKLKNILLVLNHTGVMDDSVSPFFKMKNWL